MADPPPASPVKPATTEATEGRSVIRPLTRRGYKRLAVVERQITQAVALDAKALIARAQNRDEEAPDYISPEALVYFIRRADREGDRKVRDNLFRELLERCTPYFRGKFSGFDKSTQEDLQGEVLQKLVEDLLAPDDRADFMEARFWRYLKCRVIDACRTAFRDAENTESLDTGYSGEGESEGRTKLELQKDGGLNPEQLAILSNGLAKLPTKLRRVFVLRHQVGMAIGSDNPNDDPPGKLTLARQFGCSGRTIRKWLKEADELLASFREEKDDGE